MSKLVLCVCTAHQDSLRRSRKDLLDSQDPGASLCHRARSGPECRPQSSAAELQALVERIAERIGRALERQGVLSRDAESSYLALEPDAGGAMDDLLGHSITYRVAVGPRAGQKVFALQSVPAREEEPRIGVAQYAGFSLHAGVGVQAEQRDKLERLARYVSRPPVSV